MYTLHYHKAGGKLYFLQTKAGKNKPGLMQARPELDLALPMNKSMQHPRPACSTSLS
jgi:hypothetical protein